MPESQSEPDLNQVFNLSRASVMVVDDDPFSLQLTAQVMLAFGVKSRFQCRSVAEAGEILSTDPVDLLIVDAEMPEQDGYSFVRQIRASGVDPNAFVPVIMLSSHTRRSRVLAARDCGANFIIAKPISPVMMLERILWIARQPRQFLQSDNYAGPDRRFKPSEPRDGDERRSDMRARAALATSRAARQETH